MGFFFCLFLITGLLSHHHALFPRYLYHVMKNSIAPSPIMQARHLDRMAPSTKSEWIKEWRSLRGGGHVKHSDLSPPPSPTLETPVDFCPQSVFSTSDDVNLNVISENYLRPQQSWTPETSVQHKALFILEFVNTISFLFFFSSGGRILHKCNHRENTFPRRLVTNHLLGWWVHYAILFLTNVCRACPPCSPHNMVPYWTHKPVTFLMGFQCTVLIQLVIPPTPPKHGSFPEQKKCLIYSSHLDTPKPPCALSPDRLVARAINLMSWKMTGWPFDCICWVMFHLWISWNWKRGKSDRCMWWKRSAHKPDPLVKRAELSVGTLHLTGAALLI